MYPGLRLQDLCHTHKTMLTELGVPEVLQNERLGHHPAGIQGVYAHSTPAMHADLLAALQRHWHEQHNARRPLAVADQTQPPRNISSP